MDLARLWVRTNEISIKHKENDHFFNDFHGFSCFLLVLFLCPRTGIFPSQVACGFVLVLRLLILSVSF